ncbi:MAG: cytochrome c3 family protein [Desulfurivibrionaceae bacterium]
MKKTIICSAAFALLFGFAVASNVLAEEKGPAEITLKTEAGKKPAVFPHAKHQAKLKCDDCHKSADFPKDKKWSMKAGHALCQGCHKAKNQGPTKCPDCHK